MIDTDSLGRGRPPTDFADRLRAKVWYWTVRHRSGWNDYRLDIEFVREEGEEKRSGADRRRAFGRIKRYGTVPSPGNHRQRGYDLVASVDKHPNLAGSAAVFHSSFWDLLKSDMRSLSEAYAFVSRCMETSQVFRLSGRYEMSARTAGCWPTGESICESYRAALRDIAATRPLDLDLLSLIGALYREAYLAYAVDIAAVLRELFVELLAEYCDQEWLKEVQEKLYSFAINRVLYWQADFSPLMEGQPYDAWPAQVIQRPLLPLDEISRPAIEDRGALFDRKMAEFRGIIGLK